MNKLFASFLLMLFATAALAQSGGEVRVFVFELGEAVANATATLDGSPLRSEEGALVGSIGPGQHRLEVRRGGNILAQRVFSTGEGESVEVMVESLGEGIPASVSLQRSTTEVEAAPGAVRGTLVGADGGPLEGATVIVDGLFTEATSDEAGTFEIELPPGTYTFFVNHPSLDATRTLDDVRVSSGVVAESTFTLGASAAQGTVEEVVAVARYLPTTGIGAERQSDAVLESIGELDISIAGDGDAAAALQRVTGLTIANGKYIYVRGLGERYSSTLLNGGGVPSPDPTRRVVPLDLFPTGFIQGINVQKSYSADLPGEFGGGTVELSTKAVPDQFFAELGGGVGYRNGTTWDDGQQYLGGEDDWSGYDDGTRDLPRPVKQADAAGLQIRRNNPFFQEGLEPRELEVVGESFPIIYEVYEDTTPVDMDLSGAIGNRWDLDDGSAIGVSAYGEYANEWVTRDEIRRTYTVGAEDQLEINQDGVLAETEQSIDFSAFVTVGYETPVNHEFAYTGMLLRNTTDEARVFEGFNRINDDLIRVTELRWIERQLFSQQLRGSHLFPEAADLGLDWQLTAARASRDQPDTRQYRYDGDGRGGFQFSTRADGNQRRYEEQDEDVLDGTLDFELPFANLSWASEFTLKAGAAYLDRERDASIRRFTFFPRGPAANDPDLLYRQPLEQILNPLYIEPDVYEIRDSTRATDNYTATQEITAGYVSADWYLNAPFRVTVGARYEESQQRVRTFELFNPEATPVISELDTDDILPALSATWFLGENDQLTFAYSQTLSRPDLKELSPAPYTDDLLDREVRGNPDLVETNITNYDLRWQRFFSPEENLSVALFYKDFDDPIEFVAVPGTTSLVTLNNAESAKNFGVELETRRYLGFLGDQWEPFSVSVNAAWIDSEITLRPEDTTVQTNQTRELQGQSPWVINLQFAWESPYRDETLALILNSFGERIVEVGTFGAPDIKEEPRVQLDLVWRRPIFSDSWRMTVKAENILDDKYEFTQGSQLWRSYKDGWALSLGVAWTPEL
ncbi:MAG: TonB-dependent receptor [Gammaproteobacteria bacterium]